MKYPSLIILLISQMAYASKLETEESAYRLYQELKCPQGYHNQSIEFPYYYCLDHILLKQESVEFKYSVFAEYWKVVGMEDGANKKAVFKKLTRLISSELGLNNHSENKDIYGVIDRFPLSSSSEHLEDSKRFKKYIKTNSYIYLLNYVDGIWRQGILDSSGQFHYFEARMPTTVNKLLSGQHSSKNIGIKGK